MSIWDKVKDVAKSAKCLTGWHAGTYKPIEGKPKCNLEKTCPDCKKYLTKISHKYGNYRFLKDYKCDVVQECIYCGDKKFSVHHYYKEEGKDEFCRVVEVCQRCQNRQLGYEKHNWISILGTELSVNGKRKCRDCGKIEEK